MEHDHTRLWRSRLRLRTVFITSPRSIMTMGHYAISIAQPLSSMPCAFLLLFFASLVRCDNSTFRFGAVLSTEGDTEAMREAKYGYELFFDTLNARSDGRGLYLSGKNAVDGFYFKFDFLWREDFSDVDIHEREVKRLIEEDKIHFLGGSHPTYADKEMSLANDSGILNYHCCVGPDMLYERDRRTVFGIPASNREYTKTIIRTLALEEVGALAFVYQQDNAFTRSTCEAGIDFANEMGAVYAEESTHFIRTFNQSSPDSEFLDDVVKGVKEHAIVAVIACVFPNAGKLLVDAFHDKEYPLKAFFLTTGPTKQTWVDSFDPKYRAYDLLSAAQWHHDMKYTDSFFGSALGYTELYQDKFDNLLPAYTSAGASAVGLTLVEAMKNAFMFCDILATEGNVEKLLYDADAVICTDEKKTRGYDRILEALADLDMDTFYGGVKFNFYRRNVGMDPVTTQVFKRTSQAGKEYGEIEAVLPLGYATELMNYPAENHYKEVCGPGYYVGSDSFAPCVLCEPGEISDQNNAKHCDSCPVGYWTNKPGQHQCEACPEGTHTEIRGATRVTDCICREGYFNAARERGVPCMPCPEGALCKGETAPPVPEKGYWAVETGRTAVYPCDPPTNCIGGENLLCEVGYTGR